MAIINEKNVLNESWNNQPKADVRVALQAKLRDMVKNIATANESVPEDVGLSIKDDELTVTVTLVNGNKKSSKISIESLTKDILEAMKKKATLNPISGRLEYAVLPDMVLASMGRDLDGQDVDMSQLRDVYFHDPGDGIIKYLSGSSTAAVNPVGVPSPGLFYGNAVTGKLYQWDVMQSQMRELYTDKADLSNGMLATHQWPQVVLRKVDDSTPDVEYQAGDMFYDSGYIWKVLDTTSIKVGAPSKRVVYYHQDGKKFYRWNGSTFVSAIDIPTKLSQLENDSDFLTEHQKLKTINGQSILGDGNITIEGGQGGTIAVDTELDETSGNAVANLAVTAAINEVKRELSIFVEDKKLVYGALPPVLLDDLSYEFEASQDGTYDVALAGKAMLCTDGFIRRFYYVNTGLRSEVHVSESVAEEGLVYWDKSTGKSYRWNRPAHCLEALGGDPDSKADLDPMTRRLPFTQATRVNFDSMGRELDNATSGGTSVAYWTRQGDMIFDPDRKVIRYFKTLASIEEYQPDTGLIYCNKMTGRLYRWTGSTMKEVGNTGSGGSGYNASVVEVTEISGGTYEEAVIRANSQPRTMFQWILKDVDPESGYEFRKVIWHVGNGEFIDSTGDIIVL